MPRGAHAMRERADGREARMLVERDAVLEREAHTRVDLLPDLAQADGVYDPVLECAPHRRTGPADMDPAGTDASSGAGVSR